MRKILAIVFIVFMLLSPLYADDYKEGITLRTDIDNVSFMSDFGFGLFPVATTFQFYRSDLSLFENAKYKSKIYYHMTYGFSNSSDSGREWDTGRPTWDMTKYEQNLINSEAGYNKFSTGQYFRQYGQLQLWFGQPFIDNPIESPEKPYLFEFRLGIVSRYTVATERLSLGAGGSPTFVDLDGNPKGIFANSGVDNPIVAWPWLNGDRKTLNNYLFATLYFYPFREVKESVQDGLYGYLTFEYGPEWLLNNKFPSGYTTSDFSRLTFYLEEKLVLFEELQENRWNWFSGYFGHSNTFRYTTGDVIPWFMIPSSNLPYQLTDRIWFHVMGPSFISADSYTYAEIGMTNNLYWGDSVNASGKYEGLSYTGSFNLTLHLRLFGFLRFQYTCAYNFARGLSTSYPAWSQGAEIRFYISV